jgi:serine/threonine-protein kinase HipA
MAKTTENRIVVYADWESLGGHAPMGILSSLRLRGKEIFSFQYLEDWLRTVDTTLFIDPNLGYYGGSQFAPVENVNFGIFLDSAPDRWGRMLMRRREAWQAKQEDREAKPLFETDYLLGVYDGHRAGAIRFKTAPDGEFQSHETTMATPPWTSLGALEHASLQLEREDAIYDKDYNHWLAMLVAPGSSLGGARPKASVLDEKGHLWIAKFPSSADDTNVGAWEMVAHELARNCGIQVPETRIRKFTGQHHTFLTRRFDRTDEHKRIHFASAMTLLGYRDGTDFMDGIGYLDIVAFITRFSADVKADLEQLWRRMLFNILTSNTDDHLRNHGFILTDKGWRLSPAFDMNPNEFGAGLTLNVTETDNDQDPALALSTARYYDLKDDEAAAIAAQMMKTLSDWRSTAKKIGIGPAEMERKARAFRVVGLTI